MIIFQELAIVNDEDRQSSVISKTELELISIKKEVSFIVSACKISFAECLTDIRVVKHWKIRGHLQVNLGSKGIGKTFKDETFQKEPNCFCNVDGKKSN